MHALQLQAIAPTVPPRLQAVEQPLPAPAAHEVQVRLIAASVNPIDAKRATGYGQRLLSLKKAGTFPLVLGNDLAGDIVAVGPQVQGLAVGQRVIGLRPTGGRGGTHASHFNLDAALLRPLPPGCDPVASSTLPYSYTTVRLALAGAGLSPTRAAGLHVLVHGASGALGQLAVRTLHAWGAEVTAICRGLHSPLCLSLGAKTVLDREQAAWRDVSASFDATFNFANWDDERWLLQRLKPGALGHASTVHPLLGNFDRFGWWRGAWRAWRAHRDHRALARQVAGPACNYAWTVFRPDAHYLDALLSELQQAPLALPLGLQLPLAQGQRAFEHVLAGRTGRAVLLGDAAATAFSETTFSGIKP